MINPEKLAERITGDAANSLVKGVTKAAMQIASAVVMFFFLSAATATDPYFRRKLGERYFTPLRVMISSIGWWAILGIPATLSLVKNQTPSVPVTIVGLLILFSYIIMAIIRLREIRRRRFAGELWHSRSRGESAFGGENVRRDLVIELVVIALLCLLSWYWAAFFALSRVMGYMAESIAQAQFYNRYLDINDAMIEAEFMEVALRDGLPPRQTRGVYHPLPKVFTGESRARIARVIAGGPLNPNAQKVAPEAPRPLAAQAPLESAPKIGTALAVNAIDWFVRSKRFIRVALFWLVALAIVAGGLALIRKFPFHRHHPVASAVVQSAQPQQTPAVVAQAAAPVVSERNAQLAECTSTLANKIATLAKFTSLCENKLNANDARLPGFDAANRAILKRKNDSARKTIEETLKTQADNLSGFQMTITAYAARPQADPQPTIQRLTDYYAKMENTRNDIPGIFAGLDQDFASAPAAVPRQADPAPPALAKVMRPPARPVGPPVSATPDPAPALEAKASPPKNDPVAPPKNMIAAAIGDLNVFSNYCATTLAADNDRIQRIPNNSIRAKLNAEFLQDQAWVVSMISRQQQDLENLKPGLDADASLARSTPSMILPRQQATNELVKFDAEIYNAGLRR